MTVCSSSKYFWGEVGFVYIFQIDLKERGLIELLETYLSDGVAAIWLLLQLIVVKCNLSVILDAFVIAI